MYVCSLPVCKFSIFCLVLLFGKKKHIFMDFFFFFKKEIFFQKELGEPLMALDGLEKNYRKKFYVQSIYTCRERFYREFVFISKPDTFTDSLEWF